MSGHRIGQQQHQHRRQRVAEQQQVEDDTADIDAGEQPGFSRISRPNTLMSPAIAVSTTAPTL